jgi:hypothetical protein
LPPARRRVQSRFHSEGGDALDRGTFKVLGGKIRFIGLYRERSATALLHHDRLTVTDEGGSARVGDDVLKYMRVGSSCLLK